MGVMHLPTLTRLHSALTPVQNNDAVITKEAKQTNPADISEVTLDDKYKGVF